MPSLKAYLQVAVDQVPVVHVLDGQEGLIEELKGLDLAESFVLVQIVEEVAMFGVLEHDVDLLLLLEDLVEFDDVWMLQPAVDEDLSPEVFLVDRRDFAGDVDLSRG